MTCVHDHCRQRIIRCGIAWCRCNGWMHAATALHACLGTAGTNAEPVQAERSTT